MDVFSYRWSYYGSDNYFKLDENGKFKFVFSGKINVTPYKDGYIIIYTGHGGFNDNIEFIKEGQELYKGVKLSNSNYNYSPLSDNNSNNIIDDWLYVKADYGKIYKLNLKTKEQILLINDITNTSYIENNYIYYLKENDKKAYRSDLNGKNETLLFNTPIYDFQVLNGNIYYRKVEDNNIYKGNQSENKLFLKEGVTNIYIENNMLFCIFDEKQDYGVQIFDKNGDLKLKITDHPMGIGLDNNQLLMYFYDKNPIKILDLPI